MSDRFSILSPKFVGGVTPCSGAPPIDARGAERSGGVTFLRTGVAHRSREAPMLQTESGPTGRMRHSAGPTTAKGVLSPNTPDTSRPLVLLLATGSIPSQTTTSPRQGLEVREARAQARAFTYGHRYPRFWLTYARVASNRSGKICYICDQKLEGPVRGMRQLKKFAVRCHKIFCGAFAENRLLPEVNPTSVN
jgi:hypothetical protein